MPYKTSSRLPLLNWAWFTFQVGDEFVDHLKDFADKDKEFDAKEMMTSYTLDVISNAGLGVQADSFSDPNSLIRQKVGANADLVF